MLQAYVDTVYNVLYNTTYMNIIINQSRLRQSLSKVISDVSKNNQPYIIIRDGQPSAVLISYPQFLNTEKKWQKEMKKVMGNMKRAYWRYSLNNNKELPKDGTEFQRLVNQTPSGS